MLSKKLKYRIKAYLQSRRDKKILLERRDKIEKYLKNGKVPWSTGYSEYKEDLIIENIDSNRILDSFKARKLFDKFGIGIDERAVEYPWLFSKINDFKVNFKIEKPVILDAGSTFNFEFIVNHPTIENSELYVYTFYPENLCFWKKRVSYVYGDLRLLPFKDGLFDIIVCHSTLEHIDMDNSIYGYELKPNLTQKKSYDYLKVINEMVRTLKENGMILITVPFGKFENYGFFQQMDMEMIQRIVDVFALNGKFEMDFFKYTKNGWNFSKLEEVENSTSFNPHTGKGKDDDGAAHSRAICCLKFIKESSK